MNVNNTNNTSTLTVYLTIKLGTKQDSYVSIVSRKIHNIFWKPIASNKKDLIFLLKKLNII